MKRLRITSVPLVCCCAALSCVPEAASTSACRLSEGNAAWQMAARDEGTGYRLEGTVHLGRTQPRTELNGVSAEGTVELLRYPIDSVTVQGDSLFFRFAPLGIRVQGECRSPDVIAIQFVVPQPPHPDIVGSGELTRQK